MLQAINARASVELTLDSKQQLVQRASPSLVQQPEIAIRLHDTEELGERDPRMLLRFAWVAVVVVKAFVSLDSIVRMRQVRLLDRLLCGWGGKLQRIGADVKIKRWEKRKSDSNLSHC